MITARLTGGLQKLTKEKDEIRLAANDIEGCIQSLEEQFPGARAMFCNEEGEVRGSINIYVNGDNISSLQGLATPLKEGDEVDFMSAFAGG